MVASAVVATDSDGCEKYGRDYRWSIMPGCPFDKTLRLSGMRPCKFVLRRARFQRGGRGAVYAPD